MDELRKKIFCKRSKEAELVAIFGRRRVGKTFHVRNGFSKRISFEFSGIHHAILTQQLENFSMALTNAAGGLPIAKPESWLKAFEMLKQLLAPLVMKDKTIVFFDEFPWIDTPRSGFLPAFENFWNNWASKKKNLVLIISGSAASRMIKKVINNRGGLHNRLTRRIRLLPFTIGEIAEYLRQRKVKLDKYQLLQIYMALGAIPQYLKEIEPGDSAAQNHIDIVRALAKRGKGLTRTELIATCNLTSGGYATQLLSGLTESGFISTYILFGKTSKDGLFKLTDEYTLFYLKFIEGSKATGPGTWLRYTPGSSWKSWSGNAFEGICMKHHSQIKKAIGIADVYTEVSVWRHQQKKQYRQRGTD